MVLPSSSGSISLRGCSRRFSGLLSSPSSFCVRFLQAEPSMNPWRGYRWPSGFIVGFLIFLLFIGAASADVFLTSSDHANTTWHGNCSISTCTRDIPCKPEDSFVIFLGDLDRECIVTFVAEQPYEEAYNWGLGGNVSFTFDEVENLNLSLSSVVEGPIKISFAPSDLLAPNLANASIRINPPTSMEYVEVSFSHLLLNDTQIILNYVDLTHFFYSNISWTSADSFPIRIPIGGDVDLQFSGGCFLNAPEAREMVLAEGCENLSFDFQRTQANLSRLAKSICHTSMHASSSQFTFKETLVTLAADVSSTFAIESSIFNITGSTIEALSSNTTEFIADNSTFIRVKLNAVARSRFDGCVLLGCFVDQYDQFEMVNTTAYIWPQQSGLRIDKIAINTPSKLLGVTVHVLSLDKDVRFPPFRLGSNVDPMNSNLTTNGVWLSSNTTIHTLTLMELIASVSTGSIVSLSGPGTAGMGSSWTFHSIEASEQINLNFSTVDSLIYKITNPEKGIMVNGTANVPIDLPIKVQLGTFEDPSYSISTFQWYPIITVPETYTHQNPGQVTFSDDLVLNNPTFYSVETKVEQEPSQQKYKLYYRRVIIAASSCPANIPIHFTCVNGVLIATGSIDTTTITFPPDTQAVFIPGNLTTSNPITLSSTGTKLFVEGCISAPGIEIDLEGQKDPSKGLPSDSTLIASQSENCPRSVDTLSLTVKQSKKSCKEVKVKKDDERSSSQTLAVLFSIDNSKCNTKWIILGSVLGGVVLILLVLVLVFTFSKKARECARPFSARRNTKNTT